MSPDSILPSSTVLGAEAVRHALKAEGRRLKDTAREHGAAMTLSAALEEVAKRRGFRDWNALSAHVDRGGPVTLIELRLHPWQDLTQPLPALPMRLIEPSQQHRHASIVEVMRWARQMELIATKVAAEYRSEMVALLGERTPYVLECDSTRWPDRLFHLCDRGYTAFKGMALSRDQLLALGIRDWNNAHGSHDGVLSYTVIGDDCRYSRDATLLQRMARLLASLAMEVDKSLGERLTVPTA